LENTVGDRSAMLQVFVVAPQKHNPWCRPCGDRRRPSAYVRRLENTVGDQSAPRTFFSSEKYITWIPNTNRYRKKKSGNINKQEKKGSRA
jgi:hypothetical protein